MGMGEKNGEKPKIQITESVKIGIHSTVFSVGESPNLKPNCHLWHKGNRSLSQPILKAIHG